MDQDYKEYMKSDKQPCFQLCAASRIVTNTYSKFLKPLGLTYTRCIIFLVLWEKDGVTVGQLCDKLYLDNGTITPIIKKMQSQDYLERIRSSKGDRIVMIYLTDEGKKLQEKSKEVPRLVSECAYISGGKKIQVYNVLKEFFDNYNKTKK